MTEPVDPGKCPRCGSDRWVSVSIDQGWTRRAQCVPCGQVFGPMLGRGTNHPHGAS